MGHAIRLGLDVQHLDPKAIDYFFIVDGEFSMYLIPSSAIAGRVGILLRTYKNYIVGNAGGLLGINDLGGATVSVPA